MQEERESQIREHRERERQEREGSNPEPAERAQASPDRGHRQEPPRHEARPPHVEPRGRGGRTAGRFHVIRRRSNAAFSDLC